MLLVATATMWLGTARIPRGLANAGFAVSLLTPRNSLAEKSRFIAKIGYLPDNATPLQWVHAFAATVVAATQGWPVVVKRRHGFAGQGVAICADRNDVVRALAAFAAADAQDLVDAAADPPRYLAQAHLAGHTQYFQGAAWNGRLLAGYAGEKVVANPEPTGPPTVTRYFRSPRLRAMTEQLVAGFGMSGLFVVEFCTDERTQDVHLIEVNRRVSPATHLGALRDVDLCAALYAAVEGTTSTSRAALPGR